MRFFLHTVICCCVFTTMVPLVRGDQSPLIKRLRESLQKHMSKYHSTQLSAASVQTFVGSSQKDGETSLTSASFQRNIRSSSSPGCRLITCIIHDIDKYLPKIRSQRPCAPKDKLKDTGYGRRRRMADDHQLTLQTEGPRTTTKATRQDGSIQNLCFNAVETTPDSSE